MWDNRYSITLLMQIQFIRHLDIPFCNLYARGFTSLGGTTDTHPNPALSLDSDETMFRPAYELTDDNEERLGRDPQDLFSSRSGHFIHELQTARLETYLMMAYEWVKIWESIVIALRRKGQRSKGEEGSSRSTVIMSTPLHRGQNIIAFWMNGI